MSTRKGAVLAGLGLGAFGMTRLIFNIGALRLFGADFVGAIASAIALASVLAVVGTAALRTTASKYIAEYRGQGDAERARTVLGLLLTATVAVSCILAIAACGLQDWGSNQFLVLYVPAFSCYGFFRSSYYAFGMTGKYFRAELSGAGASIALFAAAALLGDRLLAAISVLAYPVVASAVGTFHHRHLIKFAGGLNELRKERRRYGVYWLSSSVNAITSLGTFHLVILVSDWVLQDSAQTGYISVLFSAIGPMNLFPAALGAVVFPEFARRFGAGDAAGQRRLALKAVLMLQAVVVPLGCAMLLLAPEILGVLGIPADGRMSGAWHLLVLASSASVISSPCGHYLNATVHYRRHATLSALLFLAAVPSGYAVLRAAGAVGAGVFRFVADGVLAWTRMVLAQRMLQWIGGWALEVLVGQVLLVATAALVLLGSNRVLTTGACVSGLVIHTWLLARRRLAE